MSNTPSYAPTSDGEVETYVRALTDYDDAADELPISTFGTQLKIAKLRLNNRVNSDDWYSDAGLGQALVACTAIMCKATVENFSIDSWTIGDQSVEAANANPAQSQQLTLWNDMLVEGLDSSRAGADNQLSNSASFIGD